MNRKLLLTGVSLLAATSIGLTGIGAAADYTDEEGTTHYGWSLVCSEMNESCFEFGDDGNISAIYAAEGDTSDQRVNMYAIRDTLHAADESYTVQATFTPDAETDLSAERTYGIVPWYVDEDNYLIYWLQQKNGNPVDWSGQFYGRVNGSFKKYLSTFNKNNGEDYFRSAEYDDMWWDNAAVTSPKLVGNRQPLLDTTVTLKVVSKIETITVDGADYTLRSFELHQIVDGLDFISNTYYCKDITTESPAAKVGLYSEMFSFTVSDFSCVGDDDEQTAKAVETQIGGLGTIASKEDIQAVVKARNAYEGLLSLKSYLAEGTLAKLEMAENAVGTYVDGLIGALDSSAPTFKTEVDGVYNLYLSLTDRLSAKVTKLEELKAAVEQAQKPDEPSSSSSETNPETSGSSSGSTGTSSGSESAGGGCSSAAAGGIALTALAAMVAAAFLVRGKKY